MTVAHCFLLLWTLCLLGLPLVWPRAGPPERACILALACEGILIILAAAISPASSVWPALSQAVGLALLLSVTFQARRIYPAILAGMALVGTLACGLDLIFPGQDRIGFALVALLSDIAQVAVFALAIACHFRLTRRDIARPAWR